MEALHDDIDWSLATFEGSRREQRRALKLTVREHLEALEDMTDIFRRFAEMTANNEFRSAADSMSKPR